MSEQPDEPDDEPIVAELRPVYHSLFNFLDLSDAVTASSDDTQELGLTREGFTYGETDIGSVWSILRSVELASYTCRCAKTKPGGKPPSRSNERCSRCGMRREGATIVDLGSGIANVVAAIALLSSSGALGDGRVTAVHGVELLPRLHAAGERAMLSLAKWAESASRTLPRCELTCAHLESYDLSDVDLVYMASTVFENSVLERFKVNAAANLRRHARVVTLHNALSHPAFRVERVVKCMNSWGEEEAFVNVLVDGATQTEEALAHAPAPGPQ